MKIFKIPFLNNYGFVKMSSDHGWHIVSHKKQTHVVHFGILSEQRENMKIVSLIVGPFVIGFEK